jgi:hypothetical protein
MPNPVIFDFATNGDDPTAFVARTLGPAPGGGTMGVVDLVTVYRFGDRDQAWDWLSPCRQQMSGGFARPTPSLLNDRAMFQVRFGRKSDPKVMTDIPFVSVATSYSRLFDRGEPWVQEILRTVPHLGVFVVPFSCVMRPSINSHASRAETEWLYYDGDEPITQYVTEWRDNPYRS